MRDEIINRKIRRAREAFIQDLRDTKEQAICNLASSHHSGTPCRIFSITHGSFNICVCVQFDETSTLARASPDRWVVRIPFPGRVPWIDEKIDSEVATMLYVTEKTTIPVPKIHAWSYEAQSPIGHAFIIMDYVQGVPLSAMLFRLTEKWGYTREGRPGPALSRVHEQLADVYIQLRGLEFSEIGALGMPTPESPDITVRHRPLPVEVALQEVENLDPTAFFPAKKTFKTGHEYVLALDRLGMNRLRKTRNFNVGSREVAREVFFAYNEFSMLVARRQIRSATKPNEGPFVLMHGDMALHGSNLLWDEELNLVAVIDWEWCYTVPISCLMPPTWLNGFSPDPIYNMSRFGLLYLVEIRALCDAIEKRSRERWPESRLAREWRKMPRAPYHTAILAMHYPETIESLFWDFLIYKLYSPPGTEVAFDRMEKFMERPGMERFVDRKMAEQEKYDKDLKAYIDEYGDSDHCCCQNCQQEEHNFNILKELPRLSPPSSAG